MIIGFLVSVHSYSEEICVDQLEYEKALKGTELLIESKLKFEGYLKNIETMHPIRAYLDPFSQQEAIEYIDDITEYTLEILISRLGFMEADEFDQKFKQRILNLASNIRDSREELPSKHGYENLNALLTGAGYNNSHLPTTKAAAE